MQNVQCIYTSQGEIICSSNQTCGSGLPGSDINLDGVCQLNGVCSTPSAYGYNYYCYPNLSYVNQPLYNGY